MPTTTTTERRTAGEWAFLVIFYPGVLAFYAIYKYPHWFVAERTDLRIFHLFGKSPGFWYATVYTGIVATTCFWVLFANKNRYQRSKKKDPLSAYQRGKFLSILCSQTLAFYLIPFVFPAFWQEGGFFNDPPKLASKAAHVYVYPAFQSVGLGLYVFLVVPIAVWFFGKRYCSWFCSCGNLAEAIGVLPWGARWVRLHTPRGETAQRLEIVPLCVLGFAVVFGVMLFLDGMRLFSARSTLAAMQAAQDFFIDFLFGSIVGIGAYPVLGNARLVSLRLSDGQGNAALWMVIPQSLCRGSQRTLSGVGAVHASLPHGNRCGQLCASRQEAYRDCLWAGDRVCGMWGVH